MQVLDRPQFDTEAEHQITSQRSVKFAEECADLYTDVGVRKVPSFMRPSVSLTSRIEAIHVLTALYAATRVRRRPSIALRAVGQ